MSLQRNTLTLKQSLFHILLIFFVNFWMFQTKIAPLNPRRSPNLAEYKKNLHTVYQTLLSLLLESKETIDVLGFIYHIVWPNGCTIRTCRNLTLWVTLNCHHRSNFNKTRNDDAFYCPLARGVPASLITADCCLVRLSNLSSCRDTLRTLRLSSTTARHRMQHWDQRAETWPSFSV